MQELSASMRDLRSQLQCVTTECTSLKVELSGHASGGDQHRHAAVDARDAAIKDYFLSNVMPQIRNGCVAFSRYLTDSEASQT